jgi:hypothetical protein
MPESYVLILDLNKSFPRNEHQSPIEKCLGAGVEALA